MPAERQVIMQLGRLERSLLISPTAGKDLCVKAAENEPNNAATFNIH